MRTYVSALTKCAPVGRARIRFSRMAADGTLTDRELTANAALLVGAGFETTVNLIGNGIVVLLAKTLSSWHGCAMTPTCGPRPSRRSCASTAPSR